MLMFFYLEDDKMQYDIIEKKNFYNYTMPKKCQIISYKK